MGNRIQVKTIEEDTKDLLSDHYFILRQYQIVNSLWNKNLPVKPN